MQACTPHPGRRLSLAFSLCLTLGLISACGGSGSGTNSSSSVPGQSSSSQSSQHQSSSLNEQSSSLNEQSSSHAESSSAPASSAGSSSSQPVSIDFYRGVDLSYVNQMEDCGAVYYEGDTARDPFDILADQGANLVRLRLWHNPDWQTANPEPDINTYSTLDDVKIAIARAKALGQHVLLDFHYSDTWADPGRQDIPAAWADWVADTPALSQAVYDYTYNTLIALNNEGLMPELVQVGNETNGSVMVTPGSDLFPIDWQRNSALLNAGIQAVRAAGEAADIQPQVMLHIAQPQNAQWWFRAAVEGGVTDFDIIGISYYPAWSDYSVAEVGALVAELIDEFEREVIIVETGVSWTDNGIDDANDIAMPIPGFATPSPEAQAIWLIDLANTLYTNGGLGLVYWEPAWVSTGCYTQWGHGSHWEINTFFDFDNRLIETGGVRFLSQAYPLPETDATGITFRVDMSSLGNTDAAYITGSFTGASDWQILPMEPEGNNRFSLSVTLTAGATGAYYFLSGNDWGDRETVPAECAEMWDVDRLYQVPEAGGLQVLAFGFGSCAPLAD